MAVITAKNVKVCHPRCAIKLMVGRVITVLMERDHWGDPDVDGRIILRWIFRKLEGVVGTGWSWLRIGTGGGLLWVR